MIWNRESHDKVTEENAKVLKEVSSANKSIISIRMDKTRKRLAAIEGRIRELQEEKSNLLFVPILKAEVAEIAKTVFEENRKRAIQVFVRDLLKGCQSSGAPVFRDVDIRMLLSQDHIAWRSFFLFVTPEHINEAIADLPDTGISRADREAKFKQIDKEIQKQTALLNDELERAKKED